MHEGRKSVKQILNPAKPISTELVLLRMIDIAGHFHFPDEKHGVEVMGFHEIVEGIAVIPQLRIEQAHQDMRVHLEEIGKIHARKMEVCGVLGKRGWYSGILKWVRTFFPKSPT